MKTAKPIVLRRCVKGFKRRFVRCRQRGCRRVYFYDYQPYSLSCPILCLPCAHDLGHRDMNVDTITEKTYRRLAEAHP